MAGFHRQLIAGAFSDVLLNSIRDGLKDEELERSQELLRSLSYFETDMVAREALLSLDSPEGSIVSVAANLLQRGIPTRTSMMVEEYLSKTWVGSVLDDQDRTGSISYQPKDRDEQWVKNLLAALVIVDPRIGPETLRNSYWNEWLGSGLELRFVEEGLLGQVCQSVFEQDLNALATDQIRSAKQSWTRFIVSIMLTVVAIALLTYQIAK